MIVILSSIHGSYRLLARRFGTVRASAIVAVLIATVIGSVVLVPRAALAICILVAIAMLALWTAPVGLGRGGRSALAASAALGLLFLAWSVLER